MKRLALNAIALVMLTLLATTASAQQTVVGQWQVEKIRAAEPPTGVKLVIDFDDQGKATLTYQADEEAPQTWHYAYTTEANTLTLKPTSAPGTPEPKTYEMRFESGKLELLTPLPEPEEGATPPEDNRKPVWVLTKA